MGTSRSRPCRRCHSRSPAGSSSPRGSPSTAASIASEIHHTRTSAGIECIEAAYPVARLARDVEHTGRDCRRGQRTERRAALEGRNLSRPQCVTLLGCAIAALLSGRVEHMDRVIGTRYVTRVRSRRLVSEPPGSPEPVSADRRSQSRAAHTPSAYPCSLLGRWRRTRRARWRTPVTPVTYTMPPVHRRWSNKARAGAQRCGPERLARRRSPAASRGSGRVVGQKHAIDLLATDHRGCDVHDAAHHRRGHPSAGLRLPHGLALLRRSTAVVSAALRGMP